MGQLKDKLNSNQFVITSEIGPPKGICLDKILEQIQPIKGRVDAINVTDLQSSMMRLGSLSSAVILVQNGFEPVFQMTCRDRNRLALQSDLLSAASLKIENVLFLTGDHPVLGDHPQAKPVYDLDVVQLIGAAKTLESGKDMNGNELAGEAPVFCKGAAVNPGASPLEPEIIKMEKKLEEGCEFFQTQAVFDEAVLDNFLNETKHLKAKILVGLVLVKSERMAKFMNDHVPGVIVPESLIQEIAGYEDKKKACLDITIRLFKAFKSKVSGVHLMPLGWNMLVPPILDAV